jgi:hypothetical protein
MADITNQLQAAAGATVALDTDPNFNQTVLLLHGDGTNGAQNNTFLDSSSNNFTITRNPTNGPNAPTQGTFSPFSLAAGEWSNFFDGNGDFLQAATNAAFDMGTGDYTFEAWVYLTAVNKVNRLFSCSNSGFSSGYFISVDSTNFLRIETNSPSYQSFAATNNAITANTWTHVAFTKQSGTVRLFVNGVLCTTSGSQTNNLNTGGNAFQVGGSIYTAAFGYLSGHISNARVVKGRAVYTSTFIPPVAPLGATSGGTNPPQGTETSLLTCQSNRFVDNSTTPKTLTRNGDVRVTPFSPFAPSAAYDPAVNGGSGYFDGSGDYLTLANNTALDLPQDFTVEFSVYLNSTADQTFIAKWAANNYAWAIQLFSGSLRFFPGNSGTITTTSWSFAWSPTISQWYTIALTRSSGSVRAYINGAQIGSTVTETRNLTSTSLTSIGINLDGGGIQPVNGYISNLRVLKGQALYTGATYTVPDAPLTTTGYGSTSQSITGTISLLCNFTNAGIFDNTGKNNLETVGNAQIDTTTKKFGTGSMEFDGTGDYLVTSDYLDFNFGAGNFTIELWANFSASVNGTGYYLLARAPSSFTPNAAWSFWRTSTAAGPPNADSLRFLFSADGNQSNIVLLDTPTFRPTTGVWYHLAVTRSGSTFRIFIDGVSQSLTTTQLGTATTSSAIFNSTRPLYIGSTADNTTNFNGFIDDLRITKGVARYTANFTPPTLAFQDQ